MEPAEVRSRSLGAFVQGLVAPAMILVMSVTFVLKASDPFGCVQFRIKFPPANALTIFSVNCVHPIAGGKFCLLP